MNVRNLQANAFEALIAIMCIIAMIGAFVDPSSLADSSLGRTLHPWDLVWNGMFGLSGVLILFGLAFPGKVWKRWRFEIEATGCELAGLIFLGTAVFINGAAAVSVGAYSPSLGILLAVMIACGYRARVITSHVTELVPVEIPHSKDKE